MTNILTTVAQTTAGQFLGATIRSGGDIALGLGALSAINRLTETSLAAVSWMQAQAVISNEKKEAVADKDKLGISLQNRAIKILSQNGIDLLKTAGSIGLGVALIYAGAQLGGKSFAEGLLESFVKPSIVVQNPALSITTTTLMTAGNTIAGMGVIKALQSLFSVTLAGQSAMLAEGVKSNEAKEGNAPQVGDGLSKRAMRFISNDALEIPKALAVAAAGFSAMALGAYYGGHSIQSSVSKLMGCK